MVTWHPWPPFEQSRMLCLPCHVSFQGKLGTATPCSLYTLLLVSPSPILLFFFFSFHLCITSLLRDALWGNNSHLLHICAMSSRPCLGQHLLAPLQQILNANCMWWSHASPWVSVDRITVLLLLSFYYHLLLVVKGESALNGPSGSPCHNQHHVLVSKLFTPSKAILYPAEKLPTDA